MDHLALSPLPSLTDMKDNLKTFSRSFDIHTASYSDDTRGPDRQPSLISVMSFTSSAENDILSLGRCVISEVHSSYHFTWLTIPFADVPPLLILAIALSNMDVI